MYKLDCPLVNRSYVSTVKDDFELWHRRLGHLNYEYVKKLQNMVDPFGDGDFDKKNDSACVICLKGKQSRLPFAKKGTRATKMLELVHSDLCGPMEMNSFGGARYFFTLIDDYTHKVFVYFLKTKDEVTEKFDDFKNMIENQTGLKIKILRTDNGTEYCNASFLSILRKAGIQHQTTVPYTPEQNGVAERMNRTIVEKARCMLFDADLNKPFWAEAVSTAVFLINRSPTRCLKDITPEEAWSGKKPNLNNLRVFGCKAMAHVPKQKRKKWDSKSVECIFVGYCVNTKGYRMFDPTSKKCWTARDVTFLENKNVVEIDTKDQPSEDSLNSNDCSEPNGAVDLIRDSIGTDNLIEVRDENNESVYDDCDESVEEDFYGFEDDVKAKLRRSERVPKPKRMDDFYVYNSQINELGDPLSEEEALKRSDADCWIKAMNEEYQSLIENNTWTLQDLPDGRKVIDNKWVFKTKIDAAGNVRYKARLVIKGCAQKKGFDYDETYSPVVKFSSIRYLMALAAKHDLDIDQMDAVTAFLQGDLNEDIYMVQPRGFSENKKVCHLNKAIYGLKQASRAWNKKLDAALIETGLKRSKVDQCIYYNTENDNMLFVAVYVDDLLIFSNSKILKEKLKDELNKRFKMKDIGEAKFCLGLKITRDRVQNKIYIDQERYITEILKRFNMFDCNSASTPMDPNQKLTKEMCPQNSVDFEEMGNIPYQQAVGSILYASQGTRPDIAYAVHVVSRFNNNPGKAHWNAVKRIFRYLKGTCSAKLVYSKDDKSEVVGYCDADWASDLDGRRSVTGYVFMLQGGPIAWNSRKQQTVALSTTEAEYMALSSATQEAMWLRHFGSEFNLRAPTSTVIFCDNRGAISIASTSGYNPRSKHIDIRHHYVREKVDEHQIKIEAVKTEDMVADVLTKGLFSQKHIVCFHGLGLM